MNFHVITIFPDYFDSPLKQGVIGRAIKEGIIEVNPIDLRSFTTDRHRTTDDRPYGGGAGMVMIPQPLAKAISSVKREGKDAPVILFSPSGQLFDHQLARELSCHKELILVCGRYEGVDQRIIDRFVDLELSIGDYVLSGGEPAALVVIDAVGRLIPGVLGSDESAVNDSFATGLLEHPHYTRPRRFIDMDVPEVLLSGDHKKIEEWRRRKSLEITLKRRPELLEKADLSPSDIRLLNQLKKEQDKG